MDYQVIKVNVALLLVCTGGATSLKRFCSALKKKFCKLKKNTIAKCHSVGDRLCEECKLYDMGVCGYISPKYGLSFYGKSHVSALYRGQY